jgi:hypothetical protein
VSPYSRWLYPLARAARRLIGRNDGGE